MARKILDRAVPADAQRELVEKVAHDAMVMGWPMSIQKHAYENRIPEKEVTRLLDQVADYNDKFDPPGRTLELEDWKIEKQGRSNLAPIRK
jgi:cob(I)alamin adenosyltransferase